ncbi:T9SS type B sorting domain-containing protein [Litoribaculum gwangyangense]|uniref:T9SS type B sorting domain-containing protein n=1 Tax=Litoribaculum gwangyangense TaxID=1130722 RepID=A0ABP9BYT4_9FLAO
MDFKARFLLGIIAFLIPFCGASQTFVPDDNFEQALIDLGYDSGPLDDFVLTANINTITTLDIADKNISDLTGIEDFIALSVLDCSLNQLTSLDVSKNINLTELYFFNNQMASIDTTPLLNLKILWCQNNLLASVNTNQNPNLISLVCGNNLLTSLDVTQNPKLVVLSFENNQILNINLDNNPDLNRLQCGGNALTSLNLSNNLKLSYISCEDNKITALDPSKNLNLSTLICSNNLLSELDVSNNNLLTVLDCSNNVLCSLNLRNGNNMLMVTDFELNVLLKCVVVDNPLDISTNWSPANYPNYVSSIDQCANFVEVDRLTDIVANVSYTLPNINNGNYFTQSGGNGAMLNPGDTISTSQTIYIYNRDACRDTETSFNILITNNVDYYIPKYFTPNNDGTHDLWQVIDYTNKINSVTIFNQYGKLIKYLLPNSLIWDGTFKGELLPTNDYWYVVVLNTGETLRGHFSLKR